MATQPYIPGDRFEDVVPSRVGLASVRDVSDWLGVSPKTIYAWVASGKLPYVKLGSSVKFRPSAIREWLKNREYLPRELQQSSRKN